MERKDVKQEDAGAASERRHDTSWLADVLLNLMETKTFVVNGAPSWFTRRGCGGQVSEGGIDGLSDVWLYDSVPLALFVKMPQNHSNNLVQYGCKSITRFTSSHMNFQAGRTKVMKNPVALCFSAVLHRTSRCTLWAVFKTTNWKQSLFFWSFYLRPICFDTVRFG